MPTYEELFPPKEKESEVKAQPSTPLPSRVFTLPPVPDAGPSSTSATGPNPRVPSHSPSLLAAAAGVDDSHPPPYTKNVEGPLTPRARKPTALVLAPPVVTRRLSSQPATPSPLGQYAHTPLFLPEDNFQDDAFEPVDEKDEGDVFGLVDKEDEGEVFGLVDEKDDDGFGPCNPQLLGTAGSTPPSSPTATPSTPHLPINPVWRTAYGDSGGSSSPGHALTKMPDFTGMMSQRLSSPTPSPDTPPQPAVASSSTSRLPLVEASAKRSTVTVRLRDSGVAHVSGDDVSIDDDGASASASGPQSRAVAVMPGARVATLAYLDKGVAHAKVARDGHKDRVASSSTSAANAAPSTRVQSQAPTRRITGRRTATAKTSCAPIGTTDLTMPSRDRLAACLQPVSAHDVTAAGVVKARLTSTPLKAVHSVVISALPEYGRGMLNVLRIATDLELAVNAIPGTISSSGRPAAIGLFKKNHYKFNANVFATVDANFPEHMWFWWSSLVAPQRPSVSVTRGSSSVTRPARFQLGAEWSKLRLSGNCGLFDVVIGLVLWRMHIGLSVSSVSQADDINAWAELVVDVEDVFRAMEASGPPPAVDVDNSLPATDGKRKPSASTTSRKKRRRGSR
jgi:hypothetical protein